jgi:hypothetical protein
MPESAKRTTETDQVIEGLARAVSACMPSGWATEIRDDAVVSKFVLEGQAVGALGVKLEGDEIRAWFVVAEWPGYDRFAALAVIEALVRAARMTPARVVTLECDDMVARDVARREGFEGGLRENVVLPLPPGTSNQAAPVGDQGWMTEQLRRLLPDVSVDIGVSRSPFRRLVQHALSGTGAQIRVTLVSPSDRLRVLVPERDDLMPEAIAAATGTAMTIKSRFAASLGQIRVISFDLAHHGMSKNRVGGAANLAMPMIHLNAGYCCANLAAQIQARRGTWQPRRPSASTTAQFRVDKVTAHEFGHHLDAAFQASRYADSIEFRRRLGEVLGVPTIEVAVRGTGRGIERQAAEAQRQLTEQVSAYATTNLNEAMAELFAVWWFGGPESPPIIQVYDELIEKYFPLSI